MSLDVCKDKLKFASLHLLFSLFLALACYGVVGFVWYPSPLIKATDALSIFLMMLMVDLILGPLLAFVVYKKDKKTLKMDLLVVIVIQFSALTYGMFSMYQGRPVWIAFVVDRFELVRANEFLDDYKGKFQKSYLSPNYIDVNMEKVNRDIVQNMLIESQGNISPSQRAEYYQSFELALVKIQKTALPISDLNKYNTKNDIDNQLDKSIDASAYLPLKTNAVDMTVLVDKDTGKVVKIVDLRPW